MFNPAHPQSSTHEPDRFWGRRVEIDWLIGQLSRGQLVLAVYGPHRIGKTSLLRGLLHRLPRDDWPIYVDAAQIDPGLAALTQIMALVDQAVRQQQLDPPDVSHLTDDPAYAWQVYLNTLHARLNHRRVVLLIDHVTEAAAPWLQGLIDTHACPVILAATGPQQIADCLSATQAMPPALTLGPLDSLGSETMIKESLSPRSQIDPWAVRRILAITSNYADYVVLFCDALRERRKLQITSPDVEEVLTAILDQNPPTLAQAWRDSTRGEQIILAVFGSLIGVGGIATQYDIQKACSRYGQFFSLPHIVGALGGLVQRGILEKLGANNYRFTLELFRLWIARHHPPDQVLRRGWFDWGSPGVWKERLAQGGTLWFSLAVILLGLTILLWQPARRLLSAHPTDTPTVPAARLATPTPTRPGYNVTTTPTPAPTATSLPLLPGYDIAFMGRFSDSAPWQLYALNSRTGQQIALTQTGSNERTPRWSPDGERILFVSDRDGDREIYVMWADGRDPLNLTQNPAQDWQPAWSPDGQRIAFSSYRDGNWEIYVMNADGSNLTRLTDHSASDFSPTWSPDSQKILFASRRHGSADLLTIDLNSRQIARLTRDNRDEYDPAWSPDGLWIACTILIGEQSDVLVMRADGSEAFNLTQSPYANDFQPAWTLYSEAIVFASYTTTDGDHELFRVRRDGRELTRLTDDQKDNVSPSVRNVYR